MLLIFVEVDDCQRDYEVGQRFVELRGMAWKGVYPVEYECPRYCGRAADYFGVHEVGEAYEP